MSSSQRPAEKGAHGATPSATRAKYLRYLTLAEAETAKGDRVAAENFYQHAEHFYRSMTSTQ